MQEAFKVVSSPRWQNSTTDDKPNTAETTSTNATSDTDKQDLASEPADTIDAYKADASDTDDAARESESDDTLTADQSDDDAATRADVDDPEASTTSVARAYEPPGVMETAKSPLLAMAAAVAGVAALWSYTSLEDARAQLANVSSAKVSLERSLADAQSKLAVAEKTVADVKAAITAATAAPAKATGSAATK